ncbi:MAG: hypothetical protein ACT4OI_00645 [Methanobacteriota archaeon]
MALSLAPALAARSAAQGGLPRLSVFVDGMTQDGEFVFAPSRILIPQVPIILNVTFRNNESTPGVVHTFTIDDENASVPPRIDTDNVAQGMNVTLEFTILAADRIEFNGTAFAPEQGDRGIVFYCIPHRPAGMVGEIVLATAAEEAGQDLGILLRAYWIGMIGIFATLLWIGISYFVIKSSSRRFTDHRQHVRRGLP